MGEFGAGDGVRRAYEAAAPDDGLRILVERLWPRGVSKQSAKLDLWLKDLAPSPNFASGTATTRPAGRRFASAMGRLDTSRALVRCASVRIVHSV